MTEVGGKVPGGFAGDATEVFQEGIRIPPLKIVEGGRGRRGRLEHHHGERPHAADVVRRHEVDDRLALRRRAAASTSSSTSTAIARFREIREAIKDYSERRMRAEIAEMPDGVYAVRGHRDRQRRRHATSRRRLQVEVTIDGDQMTVDYTGIRPAAARPRQLHLRRHGLGDLQRAPAPHRSLHPVEPRLLPAGPDHRAARHDRERRVPGRKRRRELRDPPAPRDGDLRRARARRCPSASRPTTAARPRSSPSGASTPTPGDVFANLTNEGCGWGGRADEGRQQRPLHPERELRPAAGRDPGDAVPDRSTRRSRSTRARPAQGATAAASATTASSA